VQKGRCPAPDPQRPRDLLLTRGDRFLGAHLLAATAARVWCLVRAGAAAHARRRIAEAAARYELPEPPGDRVVPLPGDLTRPRLGLSPAR
jgi:thioester reductase-like protein